MKAKASKKLLRTGMALLIALAVSGCAIEASGPAEEAQAVRASYATAIPQETGISYERVIAHAGGAIEGNRSTNSLDAVIQSISQGYKLLELDLGFTSDGQLAFVHDWTSIGPELLGTETGYVMPFEEYKAAKILGKYQTLTMEGLVAVLDENPSVRIITDVKEDNLRALTAIAQQYPDYRDCFIPQIYKMSEYDEVKALGYKDIILTLYRMWPVDVADVRQFALDKGLFAVTMSTDYKDSGYARDLQAYGIPVYTHTVNTFEEAEELISSGSIGIYSDELVPQFWQGNHRRYYLVNTSGDALGERLYYQMNEGSIILKMKGPGGSGDTVRYYIGEKLVAETGVNQSVHLDMSELESGKLAMTASVYNENGHKLLDQNYFLWNDEEITQIMVEACEYMLDGWVPIPSFSDALEEAEEELREILSKSFIARAGSHIYYNNGRSNIFFNGNKLFPAYQDDTGSVVLAFSSSCLKLGAESVYMDESRRMYIQYSGQLYHADVGSDFITWSGGTRTMKKTVGLYRGRAVAAGDVFAAIFERTVIDQDGTLIILPSGVTLSKDQQRKAVVWARDLFPGTEDGLGSENNG